ncbi:MAG: hypothetical protein WCT05_03140 [Lentisphaeria bacterium]
MSTSSCSHPFIVNDDASTFLCNADACGPGELRQYLTNKYANREIKMVAFCAAFGAGNCYYNTRQWNRFMGLCDPLNDFLAHRVQNNFALFDQAGLDYFGHAIQILQELGIKRLASIRMNDCHASFSPYCRSAFWLAHPEYRLGSAAKAEYYAAGLNFALAPVRQFFLDQVQKIIGLFPDLDGIELDFMRSPFFFAAGSEEQQIPLMNELLLSIRNFLRSTGRNYQLAVNVPASPDACRLCGLDVIHWVKQNWVDRLAAGYYLASPVVPMTSWRQQLPESLPLYCYTNCSQQNSQYLSLENYYAIAANSLAGGADGLYLFNFCCYDELSFMMPQDPTTSPYPMPDFPARENLPDLEKTRSILGQKLSKNKLEKADKHFQFLMSPQYQPHFPPGPQTWLRQQATLKTQFYCQNGDLNKIQAELQWMLVGVTPQDQFEYRLNDNPLPTQRSHCFKGRDVRLHPEKLLPYSAFHAIIPKNVLRNGENQLELQLLNAEANLNCPIELRELELKIKAKKR